MKKQLLLLCSLTAAITTSAQITITQADIAPIGTVVYSGTDTFYVGTPVAPGGANMTWDFSNLIDDTGDTLAFVDATTLPDYSSFPSSNFGVLTGDGTGYTILNSTGLRAIGQVASIQGQPLKAYLNPPETIIKFPANYNDAYSDSSIAFAQFPYSGQAGVDSVRMKITKVKQVNIDAWGSLTVPFGTFNVIRQREDIVQDDTIDAHLTGFPPIVPPSWTNVQTSQTIKTHYSYWANGVGYPIMEVDSDVVSGQVDITWLLQSPQAGIKEQITANSSLVYPNPAADNVFIKLGQNEVATVEVIDMVGRQVRVINNQSVVAAINLNGLSNGLYSYKIVYKSGKHESGKFVVNK